MEGLSLTVPENVVLVTGASAGLGRATSLYLAQHGTHVYAGVRDPDGRNAARASELVGLAKQSGARMSIVALDVTNDESVSQAVGQVLSEAGRVDGIVNNAGFGVHGPWELTSIDAVRRQFETNFLGGFRVSKAVVPTMRQQGSGTIISISSDVAIRVSFLESIYAASKWALEAMSQGMRYELQQFGIRVCVVEPGLYLGTEYDNRIEATIDYAVPTGPYAPMVKRFDAQWRVKEKGSSDHNEVAQAVADLLGDDDPPFRTRVGCAMPRTADVDLTSYEDLLFTHYGMEGFRRQPVTKSRS